MRALFANDTGGLIDDDKRFLQLNEVYPEPQVNQQTSAYVQLEISTDTIKRLINEHKIVAEELRCLNKQSKYAIHQTLIMSLLGK